MDIRYRRDPAGWILEVGPFDRREQARDLVRRAGLCPSCGRDGRHAACDAAEDKEQAEIVAQHAHPSPGDPVCPDCAAGRCAIKAGLKGN